MPSRSAASFAGGAVARRLNDEVVADPEGIGRPVAVDGAALFRLGIDADPELHFLAQDNEPVGQDFTVNVPSLVESGFRSS